MIPKSPKFRKTVEKSDRIIWPMLWNFGVQFQWYLEKRWIWCYSLNCSRGFDTFSLRGSESDGLLRTRAIFHRLLGFVMCTATLNSLPPKLRGRSKVSLLNSRYLLRRTMHRPTSGKKTEVWRFDPGSTKCRMGAEIFPCRGRIKRTHG